MSQKITYYQQAYIPALYCRKCQSIQSAEVIWQNEDAEACVVVRCDNCNLEYDVLPQSIECLSFEYISGVKELITTADAGETNNNDRPS